MIPHLSSDPPAKLLLLRLSATAPTTAVARTGRLLLLMKATTTADTKTAETASDNLPGNIATAPLPGQKEPPSSSHYPSLSEVDHTAPAAADTPAADTPASEQTAEAAAADRTAADRLLILLLLILLLLILLTADTKAAAEQKAAAS